MPSDSKLEPLAIIGFALRFPQDAVSSDQFWSILKDKRCVMTDIPPTRMNVDGFYKRKEPGVDQVSRHKE